MTPTARRASFIYDAIGALLDAAGDFRAAALDDLARDAEMLIGRAQEELAVVEAQQAEELRGLEDASRE